MCHVRGENILKEKIRKYKAYIILAVVLVVLCLWFRPIPLADAVDKSEGVSLLWSRVENGVPMQNFYRVNPGEGNQEAADELSAILEDYRFHRALPKAREIFGSGLYTNGNTISVITYDNSVMISSTGDVFMDNHRYSFDYFGDEKVEELYARLEALVKELDAQGMGK